MIWLEKSWYQKTLWSPLLWPLTLLFAGISGLRRLAYKRGLFKRYRVKAPVIIVGNISVGGNGKTPLVIRLSQWLKQQGYHPGVLSRGYGGKGARYPAVVEADSDPAIVGDEPVLMRQHINCPMVVDPVRSRGAKHLVEQLKCDVILCDDGLQHYALERDIEIAVIDGKRRLGNQKLLPMGPLREGPWRLEQVDFVIANGGVAQAGEYLMLLEPGKLVNVKYPSKTLSTQEFNKPAVAAAAIGNPDRFFSLLEDKQLKIIEHLRFPDHHQYIQGDLPEATVVMTEKDAVKCRAWAAEDWWYLPVSAKLSEEFKQHLNTTLKSLKRTYR